MVADSVMRTHAFVLPSESKAHYDATLQGSHLVLHRDVEAEAVLFLWKWKRENSTAFAST